MKYNDPTGHFPFLFIIGLVISVASAFSNNKYIRMIGGIFGMMMMGGVNPFSGSFALTANATARIAAGAFLTTFIVSNGDFGAAMVSGITSFVTAQFSMSIGGIPESSGFFGSLPGKAILHGLVGGVASAVGGGKFGSGFIGSFMGLLAFCVAKLLLSQRVCYANCCGKLGGAIGAGWAKTLQLADNAAVTFRTTVAAVFGGMAAKASGGNFAQGAKTAAIQHLFNEEAGGTPKPKKELLSVFTFDEAFGGHAAFAFTHNGSSVLVDPNGSFVPIGANERAGFIFDVDATQYLGYWNVADDVGVFMQSIPISSKESAALNTATINPEAYLSGSICYCASTTGNFISSTIPRFSSLGQPTLPTTIRDYFSSQGYRAVRYD